jgi:LPS export ABC transporter protein LptC
MYTNLLKSTVIIIVMAVLFSCENSLTEIQEIIQQDTLPVVTAFMIEYERTDSGYRQIILRSDLMERYGGDDPYSIFPDGFEITFYDTAGVKKSFIRADYGISYEDRKLMRARNNVVVKNFDTEEQLDTENLVWDQKKKEIHSNTFVKISTPDKVVYGDSLRAHESFKWRNIYNMRGAFDYVEEDVE